MAYDYGYGDLQNRMIDLFRSGAPDFAAAEALLAEGADLNAQGEYDDDNMLSEILCGYWASAHGDVMGKACDHCGHGECRTCQHRPNLNPELGRSMCQVIQFFLQHGFDVDRCDGRYGAQCLFALTLSTFDRYTIEGTKLLLDAGAKNLPISPNGDESDTPWNFIATEASFQGIDGHDFATANMFEAVYQIYQAVDEGRPYGGIDSYEMAIGKKVLQVLAAREGAKPIFYPMRLPKFRKDNCFNSTLYFVYDDGVLITTQYADFWVDTVLPAIELVDVSAAFPGVVGSTIKAFSYDHRMVVKGTTRYCQPITTLEMDSGQGVTFSINFGDVENEDRAAYFELREGSWGKPEEQKGKSGFLEGLLRKLKGS